MARILPAGASWGAELCQALQIDPTNVTRITLVVEPRSKVQVFIVKDYDASHDAEFLGTLRRMAAVGQVHVEEVADLHVQDDGKVVTVPFKRP